MFIVEKINRTHLISICISSGLMMFIILFKCNIVFISFLMFITHALSILITIYLTHKHNYEEHINVLKVFQK